MLSKVNAISGMPRSGSTLLSALLRQNPMFVAGVTSPIVAVINAIMPRMSGTSEFASFYTDDRRLHMFRALFEGHYPKHTSTRAVIHRAESAGDSQLG